MRVLTDVCLWSLWGRGWLCVPVTCGWNEQGELLTDNVLVREAVQRFPSLARSYGRLCRAGRNDCVVYKLVRTQENEETLCYHDLRFPPAEDDSGLVFTPQNEHETNLRQEKRTPLTAWERVERTLVDLATTVRPALFGTLYLPLLSVDKDLEEEVLEHTLDILRTTEDIVLLRGEIAKDEEEQTVSQPHDPDLEEPVVLSPENTSSIADEFDTVSPRTHKR